MGKMTASASKKRKCRLARLLLFILLILALSGAIITQAQVIKIKSENNKLIQKVDKIKKEKNILIEENKNIESTIKEKETLYVQKLEDAKIAYLTFDDGPSSNTLDILKVLKQYNIKATFFVNGRENLKDLYKKIAEYGHIIANHTYSHDYRTIYKSVDNFKNDIEKLDNFIYELTGQQPNHILRYPGGSNNTISHNYGGRGIMKKIIREMKEEGYVFFDWNVDSTDASTYRQNKNTIVQTVLRDSSYVKKAVILMHDLDPKTTTVQALPEIIEGLKEQGFIFDALKKDSYAPQFSK